MPNNASDTLHADRYPVKKPRTKQQRARLAAATATPRERQYGALGSFPHSLVYDRVAWALHSPDEIKPADLEKLAVFEVRRELDRRGCRTDGLKKALVRRLRWAMARNCRPVHLEARPVARTLPHGRRTAVDVKVILTPPCIFRIEDCQ